MGAALYNVWRTVIILVSLYVPIFENDIFFAAVKAIELTVQVLCSIAFVEALA